MKKDEFICLAGLEMGGGVGNSAGSYTDSISSCFNQGQICSLPILDGFCCLILQGILMTFEHVVSLPMNILLTNYSPSSRESL